MLRGRLLSEYFATEVMPAAFASHIQREEALRVHGAFARLQRTWAFELGPASSARAVFDHAAAPFCGLLGFAASVPAIAADAVLVSPLGGLGRSLATLLVTTWGADLDRRWRDAARASHLAASRWCLCFNARAVRLVDTTRGHARAFVEFDLDELIDRPDAFCVLWMALRAASFAPGPEGPLIDRLIARSAESGEAVCASLRHGVLDSVALLLNGLTTAARVTRQAAAPGAALVAGTFEQALTIVYRVLFLLFAEAHQLVPAWHPVYRDRYTIESLKRIAMHTARPRGLWESLQAISRLAHAGCEAGDLRVTPFNGRLFSPSATPLADRVRVDDEAAREAVMALTTTRPRAGGREQIAYRDLGVEELGAVYETVLDYTPVVRRLSGGRARWRIALERSGHLRKESSTFYTPRPLTEYLVRRTLEPLVRGRDADALLSLRIVDPAMGSGAFLVSACGYLARAYEDALIDEGRCLPGDIGEDDRARFRRTIAQRCLFGVDLNPRAVQLARLSLWLTTLAADCPLTFLDHHLRTGDSLIGASPDDVARQPPGAGRARAGSLPLVDPSAFQAVVARLVPARARIAAEPGDTIDAVREKERALASLRAPAQDAARWAAVCDLWCAGWFWPNGGLDARTFADLGERLHNRPSLLPPHAAESHLRIAHAIAAELECFHWPLEFPEVFFDDRGAPLGDRGGFDAVLGNPPWDMVRADRPGGATEHDRRRVRQFTRFVRESGIFRASTGGHANRYQLFVERALQILRHGGRVGLIVPSGLATDRGSADLRRLLLTGCDTDELIGFDNRDGVFPIHRSTRFLLVTSTRGGTPGGIRCRFGVRSADTLESAGSAHPDRSAVTLTAEVIRRISPEDLAIPELQTPLDLAIVEQIAATVPALGDEAGWGVHFGRELNATDDKRAFVQDADGLPVIEGKDIGPFVVRVRDGAARVRAHDAERLLGRIPARRLAYRDVASATNRLTLIAALLPERTVSVHTLFCLKSRVPLSVQRFLCGALNSFVANYLIRMRVTTHLGVGPVERLSVPRPRPDSSAFHAIVALVERLERSMGADESAYVDLQVAVARLYGLEERQWAHIVSTFPLVDVRLRHAAVAGYRAVV